MGIQNQFDKSEVNNMTFEEKLQAYAELTVKIGVNIQPGQYLLVNTSVDALDFARIVVKEAYKAGAGRVHVNFSDEKWNVLTLIMPQMKNLIASQSG